MQKHEVVALCAFVRSKLEDIRTHKKVGLEWLQDFPRACCKVTSFVMMYYLSNIKGIPKSELVLFANAEIGDTFDIPTPAKSCTIFKPTRMNGIILRPAKNMIK